LFDGKAQKADRRRDIFVVGKKIRLTTLVLSVSHRAGSSSRLLRQQLAAVAVKRRLDCNALGLFETQLDLIVVMYALVCFSAQVVGG